MLAATSLSTLVVSAAAVLASSGFAAVMWRRRGDPTTRPLIGVAFALAVGSLLHLLVVDLAVVRAALGIQRGPTDSVGGFWILIAYDLSAVVSGLWFLFALQYTGRDRETSPVAFTAVGVLLALLVAPSVALGLIGTSAGGLTGVLNAVLGTTVVIADALGVVGVFLVFAATRRRKAFPSGQVALFASGVGAALTLPFAATTLQHPVVTPVVAGASALCFGAAVCRYRVFETLPVASVVGRDQVIDEMGDAVVVVVSEIGRVHDLNPAAESALAVERSTVLGAPLEEVAPSFPDPNAMTDGESHAVRLDSGRVLTVSADPVADALDRNLGHLLVCRDVTETRRRERRLAVLTQLVAGATQAEMAAVTDDATAAADGACDPERAGTEIERRATAVATLVARVRDVERALASEGEPDTIDAAAAVDDLAVEIEAAEIAAVTRPAPAAADPALVEATLETLAAGAVTQAETVALGVNETEDAVAVELDPFDDDASLTAMALEIADLAAAEAEWRVSVAEGVATVWLPRVAGGESR